MEPYYSFYKKGKEHKLYLDNYHQVWNVEVDGVITQKELPHREMIGYLCNVAHDGSDNANP